MPKTQKTRNVIKPALMTPELFDFLGPLFLVDGELQEVVDEFEKAKLRDKARLAGKDVDVLVKLGVSYTYAEIIVAALGGGAKTSKADRKDERKEDSKETRRPGGGPHVQIQGTMQDYLLALPVNELIEGYEPRNAAAPNNLALKTKVGDKRCVVFTDDGQVDRKVTTKLTDEIIDGQPERTKYQGPDDVLPRVVYRVGELPDELSIVRVCCAHNCEVRKDGECTSPDEEHWTNIHEVAEHVIAIGRELGDGSILRLVQNGPDLKRFLREVRGKGHDETISALKDISSNAVTVYGQRKRTGQPMPNLKRPRSELSRNQAQGGGSRDDSFKSTCEDNPALESSLKARLYPPVKAVQDKGALEDHSADLTDLESLPPVTDIVWYRKVINVLMEVPGVDDPMTRDNMLRSTVNFQRDRSNARGDFMSVIGYAWEYDRRELAELLCKSAFVAGEKTRVGRRLLFLAGQVQASLPPKVEKQPDREAVYDALIALLDAQFGEVVFRLPVKGLSPNIAPQATRAMELVEYWEKQPEGLTRLQNAIKAVGGRVQ